ncbi:hypothetical protein DOS78_03525 [Staphylococcus felis]|uniref:SdrH family protein n=1 Tax=Staphylococcus felis TaxID=46127 RepID=UPI000E21CE77|nr:SdrH family protein [Staphylococcus felis]REI25149.1 hypothetical protein DOS78_03525 [Staphylococcus felis]
MSFTKFKLAISLSTLIVGSTMLGSNTNQTDLAYAVENSNNVSNQDITYKVGIKEEPSTEQESSEEKPTEEPCTEQESSEEKPTEEPSTEQESSEEKPTEEPSTEQESSEEKPTEEPSTEQESSEEKPTEEPSTEQESSEEKPTEEPSTEQESSEEKPTEEPSTEQGSSEGNVTNPAQGNHGTNLPQSSEGALNHNQTEPNMSEKTNRFNQYFNALDNNFKYNPLFMERLQNLEASGFLNDQEFQNIDKKMPFQDNRFLNQLQQDSEYFRFQYFNPLNSDSYYKNLDKQVLALMNGEAGAMPGLKTPTNRPIAGKAQDKVETIEQNGENMGAGQHHQDKHHSNRHLNTFKEVCFIIICVLIAFLVAFLIWRKR